MTDEIRQRIEGITNANKQISEIYALLDELGIAYKRTKCSRCRKDLLNILREEAGIIESAANESDFNSNSEYIYTATRPQIWNGYIINQDTPVEVIREFVKQFPKGYYKKNNNQNNNTDNEIQ